MPLRVAVVTGGGGAAAAAPPSCEGAAEATTASPIAGAVTIGRRSAPANTVNWPLGSMLTDNSAPTKRKALSPQAAGQQA